MDIAAGQKKITHYLFDWGNTLMVDFPGQTGPMHQWPQVEAVPGAEPCLELLSKTACCCLATNAADSSSGDIRKALARVGLDRYISDIFCFHELGVLKPSPAFYGRITERLGASPETMLMVGDSLETDIIGAMNCGIRAVWFNRNNRPVPAGITAIRCLTQLNPLHDYHPEKERP